VAVERHYLCAVADLAEGTSRGFVIEAGSGYQDIFLVCKNGEIHAYRNSCPHTGGPLDWVPDQFLNLDRDLIQCATHDALFRIDDGVCVAGPCAGDRLAQVDIVVSDGGIFFVDSPDP